MTDATGVHTCTFDAANRLTSVDGVTYTWDARGNLTHDGVFTYTYNAAGRMVRAASVTSTVVYTYNVDGLRVAQAVNGDVRTFVWDWATGVPELLGDGNTLYLVGHDTLGWVAADAWTFVLPDALGSVRQEVDATGAVVAAREWSPYGVELGSVQAGLGFTGEWFDVDVGLEYLRARWYEAGTGRFTSRDLWEGEQRYPQSLNRWFYTAGNPVSQTDPTGLSHKLHCSLNIITGELECFGDVTGTGQTLTIPDLPFPSPEKQCAYFKFDPETQDYLQEQSLAYGVPWQVAGAVLRSEINLDTQIKDRGEDLVFRMPWPVPNLGLLVRPDPGPGIGNIHVITARRISEYFEEHYKTDPLVQLWLHNLCTKDLAFELTVETINIKAVIAYTRLLADYRFGIATRPSLAPHSDLSEWTITDGLAIWHGYRYGVRGVSPGGQGFENIASFQDRNYTWEDGISEHIFQGVGAELSIRGAVPIFRCYMKGCKN